MKSNHVIPKTFTEAIGSQNSVLDGITHIDIPVGDITEAERFISLRIIQIQEQRIEILKIRAFRWQAAFSLTAVLAIWLIAMRFV